ncbi:MAG: SDR family NAD(P)-dependent oxidoreductase [Candidatus Omnitrophica bacterium]|nr:SDR family NAD(P)-dependent oxidoreductase [Candidatus Omnitrophota bacterium]
MKQKSDSEKYSSEEIANCVSLLEKFVENSEQLALLSEEERILLLKAAGKLAQPTSDEKLKRKRDIRQAKRQKIIKKERSARAKTGIRKARESSVFIAPQQLLESKTHSDHSYSELKSHRNCYVCKSEFKRLHFFYDAMCPKCAEFNYQKRFQTAPLNNKVALITGSRLKIGHHATLMMLRAGAKVIATTRFPVDSALRFSKEKDFAKWSHRLHIYGLDLRHTPSVEIFCTYIEQKYDRLDLLINNAAQTVRRPPGFYAHMIANETLNFKDLPQPAQMVLNHFEECKKVLISFSKSSLATDLALPVSWNGRTPGIGLCSSAQLSQIPYTYDHALAKEEVFPTGKLDADLQQVDLRKTNSWRLKLGEIPTSEMLELQLVNAIAPFVLCNRLVSLMKRDNTGEKHIVNVSAMEGKFLRFKKSERHPHTNMAKAALNMLTHTSSRELAKYGIFMNAVDTGWVTDEDPAALSIHKQEQHDFQPPLDIVDGAARVCDPFFDGILKGEHWCGKFLKDYFPIDW